MALDVSALYQHPTILSLSGSPGCMRYALVTSRANPDTDSYDAALEIGDIAGRGQPPRRLTSEGQVSSAPPCCHRMEAVPPSSGPGRAMTGRVCTPRQSTNPGAKLRASRAVPVRWREERYLRVDTRSCPCAHVSHLHRHACIAGPVASGNAVTASQQPKNTAAPVLFSEPCCTPRPPPPLDSPRHS